MMISATARSASPRSRAAGPFVPAAALVLAVFLVTAVPAGAFAPAPGLAPPPIPTQAERDRFIQAHQAAWEAAAPSEPRVAHDEYDVTHYDVTLGLNIGAHVLTGAVELQAVSAVPALTRIDLDFFSPMVVDGVTVNGVPASYTHANGILTVVLGVTVPQGGTFIVRCAYHGTPSYTLDPFRWVTHGASVPMVLSYSEPYGAPAWWVCKDDPKDKATFAIHVTAPDTLVTVSNGSLQSVVDNHDGTATYNWTTDYPMSTYLFSIATTNFHQWSEVYTGLDGITTMDVDYYAYPEDEARARVSWSTNVDMMDYYASIFGEYPFIDEKYAIAEFQHSGAMEHQTATSMGSSYVNGSHTNDFVVAHELSHSWVGDMITMREWSHAWTKEGFATLCEALYFENKYGSDYYHQYMNSMNVIYYAILQLYDINPPLAPAIYYKGAWVLHMLRHVIGDQAFFDGIRGYTADPALRYGNSDTEDLRRAFEAASGRDLVWFFDEWIYHPGYPKYIQSWSAAPAGGGYDVTLHLYQEQTTGPFFKMPIDVSVTTSLGDERFVIEDSLFAQAFTLHTDGVPQNLVLDPDGWLIKQILTGTGVAEAGSDGIRLSLEGRPNPFQREASIRLTLPANGPARLVLYDASGRRVRTLLDEPAGPGERVAIWDGRADDGTALPSGIYYPRLEQAGWSTGGRLLLVR